MRRTAAIAVAAWAQEHVPLYRELYAGVPPIRTWDDLRRLPVLTAARLRATPLAQQVDTLDDTLRSFTPYLLHSVVTPAAILADAGDTDAAFEQCRDAFRLAGVGPRSRVALLAAPAQRYVAAELAERLGYFGVRAHVLVQHDDGGPAALVRALAPDYVVSVGAAPPSTIAPEITVRDPTGSGPDLYLVPEAGLVAVRPAGERAYVPLTHHHLIEAHSGGRLLLTALRRFHQPLVRYELADRGRVVRGRLWLDEVAP